VIPEVVGPIKSKRSGQEREFSLLEKIFDSEKQRPGCPVCGAEVVKPEGEVMCYCSNTACPAQVQHGIELFVSRSGMDIRGIGESLSATLFDKQLVKNIADLYYLNREDLLEMEGMGEKSVDNLLEAIDNSKDRPLARLIFTLGIRHVGIEMAQLLAANFSSIDNLANTSEEELVSIPTVGPRITNSIVAFFKQKENRHIIERLREAGVRLEEETAKHEELPLAGQEFVITGRLEAFSRQEAETMVKTLGGTAKDNVTRKTTYLVTGAEPGASKLNQADKLNTERLTEEAFLRKIGES
jgi:DNA ligase (NAD+)